MTHFKALSLALSGLILSAAAMAADSPAPPNQPPRPHAARPFGPGGCAAGFVKLSPEARIIHMQDVKKQADTLTVTKFREARKAECDKIAALSPEARQKYAADLDAKWKALPDSEKLKLYHEALSMRDHMPNHQGPGMEHGRGHGFDHNKGPDAH
ncbi:MAG: hypothetical protein WCD42_14200 [Rhizomicrobium sp.]